MELWQRRAWDRQCYRSIWNSWNVLVGEGTSRVTPSLVVVAHTDRHRSWRVLWRGADERARSVEDGHHIDVIKANAERWIVNKVGANDSDTCATTGRAREGHHLGNDRSNRGRNRRLQLGRVREDAHWVRLDAGQRLELVPNVTSKLKLDAEECLSLLMRRGGHLEFLERDNLAVGDLDGLCAGHEARLFFECIAAHENWDEEKIRVVVDRIVNNSYNRIRLEVTFVDVSLWRLLDDDELGESRRLSWSSSRSTWSSFDAFKWTRNDCLTHVEDLIDSESKQLEELNRLRGVHLWEELVKTDELVPIKLKKRQDRLSKMEELWTKIKELDKVLTFTTWFSIL